MTVLYYLKNTLVSNHEGYFDVFWRRVGLKSWNSGCDSDKSALVPGPTYPPPKHIIAGLIPGYTYRNDPFHKNPFCHICFVNFYARMGGRL